MSEEDHVHLSGTVCDVFAHRFVLRTDRGTILADLGPDGDERVALRMGDEITIEGHRKRSEIKVSRLVRGNEVIDFHGHRGKHDEGKKHDRDGSATIASGALREEHLVAVGQPRRKHKHVEVLGRDSRGALVELHVALDGTVERRKTIEADDDKWSEDIKDEP